MTFRQLTNGIIIAPRRGPPPKAPEGYIADVGNPYIFRPVLEDCPYRELKAPKNACCGASNYMYCGLYKRRVVWSTCKECNACQRDDASL